MYFPYFRGKMYELKAVEESSTTLSQSGFVPIIEPVKQSFRSLQKTLTAVRESGGHAVIIVNPYYGDLDRDNSGISSFIEDQFCDYSGIEAGLLMKEDSEPHNIVRYLDRHSDRSTTLIHAGFGAPKDLRDRINGRAQIRRHVFVDELTGKLYRRRFRDVTRVLLRDGFRRRKNREYPFVEFFSDLHETFVDEGMNGFGDFSIVGDDFIDAGGPAYAIAIHLTYISPSKDNEMHIYHFISDRQDTPTDPAGKFAEALEKLIAEVNKKYSEIYNTSAIKEFQDLHERGHYPGLGYIKKLSMIHHIETLAHHFDLI